MMIFISVVDQNAHMFSTHPSKLRILACSNVFGCHLYTLDLLLAQSYLPRLLQKYVFIFRYFNQLIHLHKILTFGGALECLCEFQQLAVVLKMLLQQMGWLINIYSHFQEPKVETIFMPCNYDEIKCLSLSKYD